jgi:hypothetical protein
MSFSDFLKNLNPHILSPKQEIAIINFNDLLTELIYYYTNKNTSRRFTPTKIITYLDVLTNPTDQFHFYGNSTSPNDIFSVNISYIPPFADKKNLYHKARIELYDKNMLQDTIDVIENIWFKKIQISEQRKKITLDVYLLADEK